MAPNRTKDSLAKQMKTLPIFSAQMGGGDPKFVTIFLVPKAGTNKARMIADCRDINEGMEKGPPLPFASLDELFYILSYFGAESTYLTADFRHWFYQIPLPHKVRHLFSVKAGDFMGRFDVFPMGFSWSPFVAQGLSMCAAKLAIHKAGLHPVSPLSEDDTVPPYWIIADKDAPCASLEGEHIKGFVVFWYDNLLAVTGDAALAKSLEIALYETSSKYKLAWKDAEAEKGHSYDRGIATSKGTVEYLGIHFTVSKEGRWSWRHVQSNCERWERMTTAVEKKKDQWTWRDVASLCGVVIWHWNLSGGSRRPYEVAIRLMQLIGGKMLERKQFRQRVPTEDIDHRTRELLIALLREIHTPRDAKHIFHRLAHGSP